MPRQKISFAGTGNPAVPPCLARRKRPLLTHDNALDFDHGGRAPARILGMPLSAVPSEVHSFVLSLPRSHHPRALWERSLHDYSSSSSVFFIVTPRLPRVKRFFMNFYGLFRGNGASDEARNEAYIEARVHSVYREKIGGGFLWKIRRKRRIRCALRGSRR